MLLLAAATAMPAPPAAEVRATASVTIWRAERIGPAQAEAPHGTDAGAATAARVLRQEAGQAVILFY